MFSRHHLRLHKISVHNLLSQVRWCW